MMRDTTRRLLPFHIGNDTFCVDMQALRGIERADLLQVNPGGDPFGWLLGHEEIPVIHAGIELFPGRPAASTGRILVVGDADRRLALLVDRVERAFEADSAAVWAMPRVARDPSGRLRGAVIQGESLYLLIEPQAFGGLRPQSAGEAPPEGESSSMAPSARAQPTTQEGGQLVSFSTRQAGGAPLRYGLSLRQVAEISPPPPVVSVPSAPAWLLGLVSWRQRPVPVIDLDRRLGEESAAEPDRLLIAWTGQGQDVVAFPVRKDLRVHNLPLEHQACHRELPLDLAMTRGVFEIADVPLVIPDMRKIASASSAPSS